MSIRRPSAATFAALLVTLAVGSQAGLAAQSNDNRPPRRVLTLNVVSSTSSAVTVAWPPARDNFGVAGYAVYVDNTKRAKIDPATAIKVNDLFTYTVDQLTCGKGYLIGVDAFDEAGNESEQTTTTVSTAACPDVAAPTVPTQVRQVATTETSVLLAWSPSTDDVGVVQYGLYVAGLRVNSVSDPTATLTGLTCGKTYAIGVDAADAAGNRSSRVDSYVTTSRCPTSNKPPSAPTGLKVSNATETSVALSWSPSTDDVSVAGYGVYQAGSRVEQVTTTSATVSGLTCGTTYTFGVDAVDGAGSRSTVTALTAAAAPCSPQPSASAAVTQTIVNGSTVSGVANWRAVYDKNGDKVEDDPGSMQFVVDGKVVLTEINTPFGDTDGFWASTSVANGAHTFEVRAVNDSGTVIAKNTVTATVSNGAQPAPSSAVTQTIVNGSTVSGVANWRAVYDKNGDKVEDDPGSMQFVVDGKVVLTEINTPFGDTDGFWASTSVANGAHTFEVRAVNDSGTVIAKNTVTATVSNGAQPSPDTTAPSGPTNPKVVAATANSVTTAWTAASDNVGVAGYGLYRGSNSVGTTTSTSASFGGLTCGTAYQVGVDAYDAAGNRSAPTALSVTTSACADNQPPTAPTGVTASTRTATSIALNWAASTDNIGVAGYGIYNGADLVQTTAGTTGIVGGLTCGTSYTLAVDAFDATGNSSSKSAVMVTTLPCGDTSPPSAPQNMRIVSTTPTSGTIAWDPATDNVGVSSYDVFRAGTKVGSAATTSYTVSGLACGTSSSVGVRAVDAAGNTSPQTTVTVTTPTCTDVQPPTAPTSVKAGTPTATSVPLTWTASTDNVGVMGYDVYRNSAKIGSTPSPSYAASGLNCGTTYTFAVAAYDAAGNRSAQAQVVSTTALCSQSSTGGTVFVNPNGNDSAACTQTAPCRSFGRAYRAAQPGQVVEIAAGSYPNQSVSPDPAKTGSTDVVLRPAPGATVNVDGFYQWGASHTTVDGAGGDLNISGFEVGDPASRSNRVTDITFRNIDFLGGQSQVLNVDGLTLDNLDIGGNCDGYDALRFNDPVGTAGDADDPANVVVKDSRIGRICWPNSADHPDCVAMSAGHNVTFDGNRIWQCGSQGLYLISELGGNIHDVQIQNNMFGDCRTSGGYSNCVNSLILDVRSPGLANVTVRYNAFAVNQQPMRVSGGTSAQNIQVYGNAGEGPGCETPNGAVSYGYNVWDDAKCASTDMTSDPKFVSSVSGSGFDLHLQSGSPAIGKGDPTRYPSSDADGDTRTTPPDAGADQR